MAKNAKTTSMATLTKPSLRLEVQDGGRFFADPCTSFTEKFRTRSSHFSWKSVWSMKKNRNKGICCYMCCNHFTVEAFNVCCSWNILTVTENIVNFKHFPRIFWGSEIRVGAKILDLTRWWSNRHLQSILLWCWQGEEREIYHNAEWQSAHQQSSQREQPEQKKLLWMRIRKRDETETEKSMNDMSHTFAAFFIPFAIRSSMTARNTRAPL